MMMFFLSESSIYGMGWIGGVIYYTLAPSVILMAD